MMRSHRRILSLAVLATLFPTTLLPIATARAEDAPAADTAPAAAPAADAAPAAPAAEAPAGDKAVTQTVEDFWHYGKIARYDLANVEAQKILAASATPIPVLEAFETTAAERHDNLDQWLLRWQGVDAMKDNATKLIQLLNEGHRARRGDPKFIEEHIKRMSTNERSYALAIGRLRESGELAVPLMVDYLRDPNKREYHNSIRRALRDLGRSSLNPLLATTEMTDNDTLIQIIYVLGDIGYEASVPSLVRLINSPDRPASVKSAATQALAHMGAGDAPRQNAADLYYDLGEKFYYDNASITADARNPVAYMWFWSDDKGLTKKDVPPEIFNELLAMRACEYALKLGPSKGDAVSLWLDSNYRREAELPSGKTDPTHEGVPSAHFYGVSAGSQYLDAGLARSIRDRNPAVSSRVIRSLGEIAGQANTFANPSGQPLIEALRFPDRIVRYDAAQAIAAALPQQSFEGQGLVVPLLAEAIAQNGVANVLVVSPSQDEVNGMVAALQTAGYGSVGATSAGDAINAAASKPSFDAIIIRESLGNAEIEKLLSLASQAPRLERAAKVIITETAASPYATRAVNDPLMTVTQTADGTALKPVIDDARRRAGSLSMDEKEATAYALRSADLLGRLAISRGQVLDVTVAEQTLLNSLDDSRPEIVKAVANVLALIGSKSAQQALVIKASDAKTPDELKIALFKAEAMNAKFFGNLLDPAQVTLLQTTIEESPNADVRSAAAEARGALNLTADQANKLIVKQAKT